MWGLGHDPLECLAEKETLFQILQQASPKNLKKQYDKHSIDPVSRYGRIILFFEPIDLERWKEKGNKNKKNIKTATKMFI